MPSARSAGGRTTAWQDASPRHALPLGQPWPRGHRFAAAPPPHLLSELPERSYRATAKFVPAPALTCPWVSPTAATPYPGHLCLHQPAGRWVLLQLVSPTAASTAGGSLPPRGPGARPLTVLRQEAAAMQRAGAADTAGTGSCLCSHSHQCPCRQGQPGFAVPCRALASAAPASAGCSLPQLPRAREGQEGQAGFPGGSRQVPASPHSLCFHQSFAFALTPPLNVQPAGSAVRRGCPIPDAGVPRGARHQPQPQGKAVSG